MEKRTDKRESKKKVAGVSNSSSPRAPLASALPSKFSLEVCQVSALILVNESTSSNFVVRDIFRYDFLVCYSSGSQNLSALWERRRLCWSCTDFKTILHLWLWRAACDDAACWVRPAGLECDTFGPVCAACQGLQQLQKLRWTKRHYFFLWGFLIIKKKKDFQRASEPYRLSLTLFPLIHSP